MNDLLLQLIQWEFIAAAETVDRAAADRTTAAGRVKTTTLTARATAWTATISHSTDRRGGRPWWTAVPSRRDARPGTGHKQTRTAISQPRGRARVAKSAESPPCHGLCVSSHCYWSQSATGCADVVSVLMSLPITMYSVVRDVTCMPRDDVINTCDSELLVTSPKERRQTNKTTSEQVMRRIDWCIEQYCQMFCMCYSNES